MTQLPSQASTVTAKAVMGQLLRAQQSGQYVEWVPWYSRHSIVGYATQATGEVTAGTTIQMFSATQQAQTGQGFNRQLTPADTVLRSGDAVMPGGQEFVGFSLGMWTNPEMPNWISEAILYYGTLSQKRHVTEYEFGQAGFWSCGDYGIQSLSASAATTAPATTIDRHQRVNGGVSPCRELAKNALIALPAKQPIEFLLRLHRGFFATIDGATGGGNISNSGEVATGAELTTQFQREVCGIFGIVLWGYRFSLPG
ncbi:hypothetical protein K0U83_00155 [bacterium]|nr:hypothetical protein [bacterium]